MQAGIKEFKMKGGGMRQHTVWERQHKTIKSQYGTIPWIAYCCNECERFKAHGREAELRYNKQGQVAIFVDIILNQ